MHQRILSQIWIYPIKSLGGIRVKSARVFEKGLQHDRRWMLIDENNQFMTQRVVHKMALFKQTLEKDAVTVRWATDSISIPFSFTYSSQPISSKVWDDDVVVHEVAPAFSKWFSERLAMNCRLVTFPEVNARPVDETYQVNHEQVSLADAYPILIIGQSSLDDLNSRLEEHVPMNRFRPNLVFTGGTPYEEDGWRNFSVGHNRMVGVKPCARCIMTTVNQDTAEKGREPLLTLSRYRKKGEKILFGQNVVCVDHNEIHEGDTITF